MKPRHDIFEFLIESRILHGYLEPIDLWSMLCTSRELKTILEEGGGVCNSVDEWIALYKSIRFKPYKPIKNNNIQQCCRTPIWCTNVWSKEMNYLTYRYHYISNDIIYRLAPNICRHCGFRDDNILKAVGWIMGWKASQLLPHDPYIKVIDNDIHEYSTFAYDVVRCYPTYTGVEFPFCNNCYNNIREFMERRKTIFEMPVPVTILGFDTYISRVC
jgi:hypothetical protein